MIERKTDRIEISAGDMRTVVNNDKIAEVLPEMHEMALQEIDRLRQVCVTAAADLLAVIGGVDNVRLTLWLAVHQARKQAGEPQPPDPSRKE